MFFNKKVIKTLKASCSCGASGYCEEATIMKIDENKYEITYFRVFNKFRDNDIKNIDKIFLNKLEFLKLNKEIVNMNWDKINGYNERLQCFDGVGSNMEINYEDETKCIVSEYMKGYPFPYKIEDVFKIIKKYF